MRIAGFKSFAEPTALEILPGLTGIVGPNGCGKSNVVEALRWAMGETSARSLRGGEMDDVIFAGTTARSSRNLAEVSITLARGETPLPDPFGAEEELQVTRRIERGAGSQYRANNRDLRARDVQTLFADLASGARSCAMVSQGRVSALVQASPEDRRSVLPDEAAGITGLHARRHEAELKLRAADTNLTRAEELRAELDTGREGLRRQARQAARYRNISGLVRAAEADYLAVLHARARQAGEDEAAAQARAIAAAEDAARAAQAASADLATADATLPPLRDAEAAARGVLERRRVEAESLAQEAARANAALAEAQARLAVIRGDLADASALAEDADQALARLGASAESLQARVESLPAEMARGQEQAAQAAIETRAAEEAADAAASRAAEANAAAAQAALATRAAEQRAAEAATALDEARAGHAGALAAQVSGAALDAARQEAVRTAQRLEAARLAAEMAGQETQRSAAMVARAETDLARETERAAQARRSLAEAQARRARLDESRAEITGELEAAAAARVAPALLDAARHAEAQAQAAVAAAEHAAGEAELAQAASGAACLPALTRRDQLAARRTQLETTRSDAQSRQLRLREEAASLAAHLAELEMSRPAPHDMAVAETATAEARQACAAAEAAWREAAARREAADRRLAEARAEASAAAADRARLEAEEAGTRQAIRAGEAAGQGESVLGQVDVPAGLEAAVGAVLADAADRLEDGHAARFWRDLPALPAGSAPMGCAVLDSMVHAPAALARAFGRAALLGEGADGDALQAGLAPGWVLVSARGDVWRWDGQVSRAEAPSAAACRLGLLARLRDIVAARDKAMARDAEAARAARAAEAAAAASGEAETAAHASREAARAALAARQREEEELAAREAGIAVRLAAVRPALARLEGDLDAAGRALAEADATIGDLPAIEDADAVVRDARRRDAAAMAELGAAREARQAARRAQTEAVSVLRALEDREAGAASRVAGLAPQRDRLARELADAVSAQDACAATCGALPDLNALGQAAERAVADAAAADEALSAATRAVTETAAAQTEAAQAFAALDRRDAEARAALAAASHTLAGAGAAQAREADARDACRAAQAALPDPVALAAASAEARQAVAACRARDAALAEQLAVLAAALAEARASLPGVEQERAAWLARQQEAARRRAALVQRQDDAGRVCAAWADAPRDLAARGAALDGQVKQAEAAHVGAADALRAAEGRAAEAGRAQREAEAAQSACREAQARGEGRAEAARAALAAARARAAERLGPDARLPEVTLAGSGEAEEERARRKHERLSRERDEMGPVNLRADIELSEIEARLAAIDADREALATAIAKLRGSIGHLNREGRERLREVFAKVDAQFRTLFTRMMGGGRAHLALVGSEDPLEAGLEIYAEPPGKKLSALSLLSGGEQALTALSLIFAVFACTPAPVAVLDEVDAPLDDVNVDRFCGLLEDVVRETGTRFLVVTHHQLTMSRMDRLYGVTMQERGVSRVLSVDLQRAAAMVAEPVLQAAE